VSLRLRLLIHALLFNPTSHINKNNHDNHLPFHRVRRPMALTHLIHEWWAAEIGQRDKVRNYVESV
jgi:hypothetical protein